MFEYLNTKYQRYDITYTNYCGGLKKILSTEKQKKRKISNKVL